MTRRALQTVDGEQQVVEVEARVERNVAGDAGSRRTLLASVGTPQGYAVGRRYLFVVATGPGASRWFGDQAVRVVFPIDADAALPPETLLRQAWREHCMPDGTPVPVPADDALGGDLIDPPTARRQTSTLVILEGMRESQRQGFLRWCQHL